MIDVVAKDKGIDPSIVIGAIEDAYLAASRKVFKGDEDLRTRFNLETGQVELYAVRLIVAEVDEPRRRKSRSTRRSELYGEEAEVGMEIEFPKETEKLGRIAAQTAKQVIAQRVREAEREKIHGEFSQRIGEVVNATVKRFESGDIIAEIGRVEAQIPRKEQSRAENYAIGDRVRAVIKAVTKNAKGPQVILSRTDPALLVKLFEQEVPEIYDGTVMIRGAVREAGDRAKVAVFSRERDVDPVGACVGMRGTRVQAIIRELRGEKIDIVEWSEDPVHVRHQGPLPGPRPARHHRRRRAARDGGRGRGSAAVARDRQEGPERPSGREAHRLEDRHQERRRQEKEVELQLAGIDFGGGRRDAARTLALPGHPRRSRGAAARGGLRHGREGPRGRRPSSWPRCRASTPTRSRPCCAAADERPQRARRREPPAEQPPSEPAEADGGGGASRATLGARSRSFRTKERIWPLSGSTRSPSCWVCRARTR